MVSFRAISQNPVYGRIVSHLKSFEFDVDSPDAEYYFTTKIRKKTQKSQSDL
jgi:hypothetical protein